MLFHSQASPRTQTLDSLTWATEIYPPFSHYEDNKLTGYAVEFLHLIWQELGLNQQPILVMPWARAYYQLQHQNDMVLFTVSRLEHREHLFQWACPIDPARYILFSLKHNTYRSNLAQHITNYQIGTVREDAAEQMLLSKFGQDLNLVSNVSMQANLEMLEKGRIDFIAYDERSLSGIGQYGFSPDNYQKVMDIHRSETCYAFSHKVPSALVTQFKLALGAVMKTSQYQLLRKKYALEPIDTPQAPSID